MIKQEFILAFGNLEVKPLKRKFARFDIRNFLLRCWKRRLYLEAICWSKNQDPIEYNINVVALYDALTRAMHYSWWEWLDGSQLFFWSWPSIWMKEDRYGAHTFNLYFTLPKLRLYFPPIKKVD